MGINVTLGITDASLDAISALTNFHICSAEPSTPAGVAALSLATGTLSPSDFAKSGTSLARVLTLSGKQFTGATAGTGNHLVLTNGTNMLVTTMTPVTVVVGVTRNLDNVVINQSATLSA